MTRKEKEHAGDCGTASLGSLLIRGSLAGILLLWLPLLGPFLAGFSVGRRAGCPKRAATVAAVPAIMVASAIYLFCQIGLTVNDNHITPPFEPLAPASAGALLAGALAATGGSARWAGMLLLALCVAYLYPHARQIGGIVRLVKEATAPAYAPEKNKTCPENLRQLYLAAMLYADSWDGMLPPAKSWLTAIKDNVTEDNWLHCPEIGTTEGARFGYAMNTELGGKRVSEIASPEKTPLFFESSDLAANANGSVSLAPSPGRHMGRNNVVYADGKTGTLEPFQGATATTR